MRGFFDGERDDENDDDEEEDEGEEDEVVESGREVDENENIWILRYINCRASRI